MSQPYNGLPQSAFWRTGVADCHPLNISQLWTPKFRVGVDDCIVTAGSCFAQHIGRALTDRGHSWLDAEPAPPLLSAEQARAYNYGIFSFRTGNIYTTRMLRQWLEMAYDLRDHPQEIWQSKGRFFDPLRPGIEPNGFASQDEALRAREPTLFALRKAVETCSLFVFTLGLTESWQNTAKGYEYAACPGTVAGTFDKDRDVFENQEYPSILEDLTCAIDLMTSKNAEIRVLLTVSPVPLTATASGKHVLVATSGSKSILRAVAGQVAETHDHVDYFPSYEIITSPAFQGMFYDVNKRSVIPQGVAHVMTQFFADQERKFGRAKPVASAQPRRGGKTAVDVVCDEEMLDAFAER